MNSILQISTQSAAEIVLRTCIVYLFILLGLRLAGKRELGQLTTLDLVLLLVISNAVQNAMVGSDTSLSGGLLAACTLLALNILLVKIGFSNPRLRSALMGNPTLLVHDGVVVEDHLKSEAVDREELMQALREHGVETLEKVRSAVLEVDGTISVIPREGPTIRTRHKLRMRKR